MGWQFRWVSSQGSDFNFDYHVSFTPDQLASGQVYYNYQTIPASIEELSGLSVFYKDQDAQIFHTYSAYGRGNEEVLRAYMYLDITPNGRAEDGPNHNLTDWVRHHDRYGRGGHVDDTGAYIALPATGCLLSRLDAAAHIHEDGPRRFSPGEADLIAMTTIVLESAMKYLCQIFFDERNLNALSEGEHSALTEESLDHDDRLRMHQHLLAAHALEPVSCSQNRAFAKRRSLDNGWSLRRDARTDWRLYSDRSRGYEGSAPTRLQHSQHSFGRGGGPAGEGVDQKIPRPSEQIVAARLFRASDMQTASESNSRTLTRNPRCSSFAAGDLRAAAQTPARSAIVAGSIERAEVSNSFDSAVAVEAQTSCPTSQRRRGHCDRGRCAEDRDTERR
jgi:hypothetical protein